MADHSSILATWNDRQKRTAPAIGVHELLAAVAIETPNAVALVCGNVELTYVALFQEVERTATWLRKAGIGPEKIVAVYLERSIDMVVALLGVLSAGGAYLPLDPDQPVERSRFMLRDSGAEVLLARRPLPADLAPPEMIVIFLGEAGEQTHAFAQAGSMNLSTQSNAAYVIYTSGSSGRPKAVIVEHRNLTNHTWWFNQEFQIGPGDRILQRTPFTFDASVWEIFSPLAAGATLVLAPPDAHRDVLALSHQLQEARITRVQCVPSLLRALLEAGAFVNAHELRTVFCGGEALPMALVRRLWEQRPVQCVNLYGPTETTIDATFARLTYTDDVAPIGMPIGNARVYVVDERGQPVEDGAEGELWIGGAGVARGYLNLPQLTASKFVAGGYIDEERLYRTGDRVRRRSDGRLDFLGRLDDQIKLRGYRIELAEIEEALRSLPGVSKAAVAVQGSSAWDQTLVGYAVAASGAELDPLQMRGALARQLPEPMVPSRIMIIGRLPLTAHGKLDRNALAHSNFDRPIDGCAPRTEAEALLVRIWADALGLDNVGVHDNFFELGGHSLLAARIAIQIRREFKVDVTPRVLFEKPTVAALATHVVAAQGTVVEETPLPQILRDSPQPLSFGQESLWLLHHLASDAATNNVPVVLKLRGALDRPALQQAIDGLVARHQVLRTRYINAHGVLRQIVCRAEPVRIESSAASEDGEATTEREIQSRLQQYAARPFDLANSPAMRVHLHRQCALEHWLLLSIHHIAVDAQSIGVLVRDLAALYTASLANQAPELPALPAQFIDWAASQRRTMSEERIAPLLSHWTAYLKDAPLLLDLSRRDGAFRGGAVTEALCQFQIPELLTSKLRALAAGHEVTLFTVLLAALQTLIFQLTNTKDFLIGVPVSERRRKDLTDVVGFFVNTVPIRANFDLSPHLDELLWMTHASLVEAHEYRDLPFDTLVRALRPPREAGRMPLVQIMLNFNEAARTPALAGLNVQMVRLPLRLPGRGLDVLMELEDQGAVLNGSLELSQRMIDRPESSALIQRYLHILEQMATDREGQSFTTQPISGPQARVTSGLVVRLLDGHERRFNVEVARDREQINRGLMFRTDLADDAGALLLLEHPEPFRVWMRNTYIPLDLAYIDKDGILVKIVENAQPRSLRFFSSNEDVLGVLELRGGTLRYCGIAVGDRVLDFPRSFACN